MFQAERPLTSASLFFFNFFSKLLNSFFYHTHTHTLLSNKCILLVIYKNEITNVIINHLRQTKRKEQKEIENSRERRRSSNNMIAIILVVATVYDDGTQP
jgi:hypothetical protein